MLRAAIDIGSNSVRMLAADVNKNALKPLSVRLYTTRLYEGLSQENVLGAEAILRTVRAAADCVREARGMGIAAENIFAYATSAVRDAVNREEFLRAARRECQTDVKVLTGAQEAEYAFFAAARKGDCGVIDIGGASTELICGCDGKVRASYSAQLGALRLRRILDGRCSADEMVRTAEAMLQAGIAELAPLPAEFVGVAGTITTLYAMHTGLKEYAPEKIQGGWLPARAVQDWLVRLCAMPMEDRKRIAGLPARRADIIDYGAAILTGFFRLTGLEGIYVSDRDNLYAAAMRGC